jgi:hypothetical protein
VSGRDFFISYASADQTWAEWIADQLEAVHYTTVLQAWDFRPGSDFLHLMQQATSTAKRTIAVLSPAYFGSRFGEAEWRVAFAKDPTGEQGLLVPVRVQDYTPPGLLASRVYINLVGLDEQTASATLLAGLNQRRANLPVDGRFPARCRGTRPDRGSRAAGQRSSTSRLVTRTLPAAGTSSRPCDGCCVLGRQGRCGPARSMGWAELARRSS